jgi:hypothetical protein
VKIDPAVRPSDALAPSDVPPELPDEPRGPRPIWTVAPLLVLAAAVGLRIELYVHNRSFWLDESLVGLNLIEKSPRQLLQGLDFVQSAPAGFLLIQKGMLGVFGETERAMRLVPLLCSIAGLFLFWLVARRLLPHGAAVLALVVFAANGTLIYQSSEAKPYSGDVAIALLLMWLALLAFDAVDDGRAVRALLPFTVAGLTLAWFSFPSVFVLVSGIVAIYLRARSARVPHAFEAVAISAVLVGASALADYLVTASSTSSMQNAVFVGETSSSSQLRSVAEEGWASITDPGGFPEKLRALALFCLIVGAAAIALRAALSVTVLLLGPGVVAVMAAIANKYPLGGRYSLFLVPFLALLVAAGAAEVIRTSRRPLLVGLPLVLLLAAIPVWRALEQVVDPPSREDVRPLLKLLERQWRPGDAIYVYRNAQYALRFYGECRGCGVRPLPFPLRPAPSGSSNGGFPAALASGGPVIVGRAATTPAAMLRSTDRLKGRGRMWLLFAHPGTFGTGLNEQDLQLAALDGIGRRLGAWTEPGAALYLYDTSRR